MKTQKMYQVFQKKLVLIIIMISGEKLRIDVVMGAGFHRDGER